MSETMPQDATRSSGDREYFWFALLLIAVLTTSVDHASALRNSAANVETPAAQP